MVAPVVLSLQHHIFTKCHCVISLLSVCQGSDSELKVEKDGVSDSESKVDSGVPEVPVPADDTPVVLNKALSGLSSRYRHCSRKTGLLSFVCSNESCFSSV